MTRWDQAYHCASSGRHSSSLRIRPAAESLCLFGVVLSLYSVFSLSLLWALQPSWEVLIDTGSVCTEAVMLGAAITGTTLVGMWYPFF